MLPDRNRLLTGYYLATPAFWLLDLLVQAPIRAAALEQPGWRFTYYVFAFACGLLCRWRPRLAPVVGMAESSVNVLLLVLSVLLPIYSLPGQLESGRRQDDDEWLVRRTSEVHRHGVEDRGIQRHRDRPARAVDTREHQ